jgi:hypothetical protein
MIDGELDRVEVCEYTRMRFGRLESVCAHTRGWPARSTFDL